MKKLRTRKGLTQEELARRAGVTRPYITMIERGAKTNPSVAVVRRLARALGAAVTELLK